MEIVWRPFYEDIGKSVQIITHVLYDISGPPPGLNWDMRGMDDPFVDDPTLTTFNADTICE